MNIQKGFISLGLLIAIILGVVVIGGGAYYLGHQNAAPQVPVYQDQTNTLPTTQATTQATTQTSAPQQKPAVPASDTKVSATIDNPLVLKDGATLSGTISANVSSLSILVGKGTVTPPKMNGGPNSMPSYALGEGSAAGGITISNGHWTAWIVAPSGAAILQPGTYTVALYDGNSNNLLTSTILTVKAGSNASSVSGMSKYTDANFGFSFWYPSSWTLSQISIQDPSISGGSIVKTFKITDPSGQNGFYVEDIQSSADWITVPTAGCDTTYSYVHANLQWVGVLSGCDGTTGKPSPAQLKTTTMGGLPAFDTQPGISSDGNIVPLSLDASRWVLVNWFGSIALDATPLTNTIVAAGTSVSATQENQTVQAEATAYAGK